jgi:Serine carboxypeptidase
MLDDPQGKMALFYNNPSVQKALHVEPSTFWIECMPGAGRRRRRRHRDRLYRHRRFLEEDDDKKELLPGQILLAHDQPISTVPYVADLLDHTDIEVLIYNGDLDMTTNVQGSEYLLDHMKWKGAVGWSNPSLYQRGLWIPRYGDNTTIGGYMKEYRNLHFLTVSKSGHLVPFNRPQIAHELVLRFLGNISFIDATLPKYDIMKKSNFMTKDPTKRIEHTTKSMMQDVNIHVTNHFISWMTILLIGTTGFLMGCFVSRFVLLCPMRISRRGYQIVDSVAIK